MIKKWLLNHKVFIVYSVFGIGTTIVNIGAYMILSSAFGAELYQLWNVIAWLLAVLYSFVVNKKYVFKSKAESFKESFREFYGFLHGRALSLVLDILILFVAVSVFDLNDKIVKIFSNIIVVIINYYYTKKRVFKK